MKRVLTLLALVLTLSATAQTYVTASVSYFNGAGTFNNQAMPQVELGRVVAPNFTLGIAGGKTSFTKDGEGFVELRPTVYYSSGRWSQGFTIGAGYVHQSQTPFMVEWATSTNYSLSSYWGVGVSIGGYKFNGKNVATNATYFGAGLTHTFRKDDRRQ